MPEKQAHKARRVFVLNPRFQFSFVAITVGIALAAVAVFYAADLHFFNKFYEQGRAIGLPADHVFFQFIDEQRREMNRIFLATSGLAFLILTVSGIVMSHRVAGPLYRLRNHLIAVARGETSDDVKFRKRDYFQDVAEATNQVMARVREKEGRSGDRRSA